MSGDLNTAKEHRYTAGTRLALVLDGLGEVGTLQSVSGGSLGSTGPLGGDGVRLLGGRPRYEDLTFRCGMAMAPPFWRWVDASLRHQPERRSGAVLELDFDNRVRGELEFRDALLAEVGFPLLDAAQPAAPLLTLKLAVESLRDHRQPGRRRARPEQESPHEWDRQRRWSTANFALVLDRFPGAPQRTLRVEPMTLRQTIIEVPTGGSRAPLKEPGRVEMPTLEATILTQDGGPWATWYRDFVEEDVAEPTCADLAYLDASVNQKQPLMTMHLGEVGLIDLCQEERGPARLQPRRLRAKLRCESLRLEFHRGAAVGT